MTETTQYQDLQELARELAVVDLTNSTVVQRLATEHYPYAVSVARDDTVYVSAWGGKSVSVSVYSPTVNSRTQAESESDGILPRWRSTDRAPNFSSPLAESNQASQKTPAKNRS